MTPIHDSALDERSRAISTALDVQRRALSARFARQSEEPRFPRSVTMRVLVQRPAMVARLLPIVMGSHRLATLVSLLAIAGLVRVLYRTDPRSPS